MKSIKYARYSVIGLLALSACVQPASTSAKTVRSQTSGPISITAGDKTTAIGGCKTTASKTNLGQISDGADALFEILSVDAGDLNTIHDRATFLAGLETDYAENFADACTGAGLTPENTAARIEKLNALAKETDVTVIHALAAQIWDLFNPNIQVNSDGGTSSPNPFAEPAARNG